MSIQELIEDFAFLDDWEDRYRYVIELGKKLAPLTDEERNDETKVLGCTSQVWLVTAVDTSADEVTLSFRGDSDAHIVRGLIAILLVLYSGKTITEILAIEPREIFTQLGLNEHLSPQRSNGLFSMVGRVRADAAAAAAT
ncbi:MAG: SufE family protein [Parvibaculaceae bacterium]|nr:SufE family protein [Parvibaculaceae bacterium]